MSQNQGFRTVNSKFINLAIDWKWNPSSSLYFAIKSILSVNFTGKIALQKSDFDLKSRRTMTSKNLLRWIQEESYFYDNQGFGALWWNCMIQLSPEFQMQTRWTICQRIKPIALFLDVSNRSMWSLSRAWSPGIGKYSNTMTQRSFRLPNKPSVLTERIPSGPLFMFNF